VDKLLAHFPRITTVRQLKNEHDGKNDKEIWFPAIKYGVG
jgi:hypothetical protein